MTHGGTLRTGRLVPVQRPFLHGQQYGAGGEQLGHRGEPEGAVLRVVAAHHGTGAVHHRDRHRVDRPLPHVAHAVHSLRRYETVPTQQDSAAGADLDLVEVGAPNPRMSAST